MYEPVALKCGHIFCFKCACSAASVSTVNGFKKAKKSAKCPLCREVFTVLLNNTLSYLFRFETLGIVGAMIMSLWFCVFTARGFCQRFPFERARHVDQPKVSLISIPCHYPFLGLLISLSLYLLRFSSQVLEISILLFYSGKICRSRLG